MDEIAEFARKTLEGLRQPLEDGAVTISRVWGSNTYPAVFMLVGAMNPCPCGYFGQSRCRCTDYEIQSYRKRLSGPIMDRIDIQKYVGTVDFFDNVAQGKKQSSDMRLKVEHARAIQNERYKGISGITHNAQLTPALLQQFCPLDQESLELLRSAVNQFQYSGRTIHKYIKIARTIADLEGDSEIEINQLKKVC